MSASTISHTASAPLRLRWRSLPFAGLWASVFAGTWCLWGTAVLGGRIDVLSAAGFGLCMVGGTLCHELGHAVAAIATSGGAAEVGFTPLGGRTYIDSDEIGAVVAISGPAAGLALAAVLWASGQHGVAATIAFIEVFNLLPFWERVDGARFLSRLASAPGRRAAKAVVLVTLGALATAPGLPPPVVGVSWLLLLASITQALAAVFDAASMPAGQPR